MKFQTLCMSLLGAAALATALPVDTPTAPTDPVCLPFEKVTKLAEKFPGLADELANLRKASQPEKRQDLKVDEDLCRALKATPGTVSIPNRNALQKACNKLEAEKGAAQPEKRQEQPPSVNKAVGDVKAAVGNAAGLGLPV
ncbi:hypothetical protein BDV32DRAFT_148888 [Aspergillus pseudonomiae]|uniref:Uncharacterized protein n=1 Tax=Aspergillus pseudonomiae TaxID=1506151 RepID=A0A5N6I2S5_9EURO|nr:uncharacterized protein BDV37DRAFT_283674 [Aspergillus pseudonomiae]KAB8261015.1 hypothetical protein BDV32DRAFT_148888 [Aspergillus pseudonomiae]KAE8403435.1 hypothetical protein BDV37DRAFT_283674 [Aspergillus pseudonomiae]